ncbi:hypothetical protein [Caldivirga maquilingensis]|uniref:Uncharacterized protein n=1 Tax=Caldivirga maquilingensis (strain ATCC 700844 / DSM 13496 / JCM 10307 / IC-167) TaxID=397948 RepID=A8M9H4_CALMQ|nr:hypothetical protein [Caldivirga maquilingensis]ABW00855.1 hypothetical protein Cmaq_0001 [Caldivirga maquilingensis IC-167]
MSNKSGKYGIAKILPVLAVALALALAWAGHAVKAISLPGPPVPPTVKIVNQTFTISLNLAYAQPPVSYVSSLNTTLVGMYHLLYDTVPAYYGVAGQTITFYILNASDIKYPDGTLVPGSYLDYFNTAVSSDIGLLVGESFTVTLNSTGGFTSSFQLPVSPESLNYSSFTASWFVVVTINYDGYQWVAFNFTTAPAQLGSLLANLTSAASSSTPSFLTAPNGKEFQIMVQVNGTTGEYYALPLPGVNVIYIWFGTDLNDSRVASSVSSSILSDLALTFAEYYNGTPIIVNSSLSYNPTASQFSTSIYGDGVSYAAFGPLVYFTGLIFQNGHLLGYAEGGSSNPVYFTINVTYSYYNPGTQSIVSVPVYATTNYASAGYSNGSLLLGGALVGYDFHYDAFFNITSMDGYGYGVVKSSTGVLHFEGLPDLVIAGGLITLLAHNIYDIKGNLIAASSFEFSPTASLLFEITTGPQLAQILYGPLPISFLIEGFTIPAVEFTGTVYPPTSPTAQPISPTKMMLTIELQTTSGTWDVALLNISSLINLAIKYNTPTVTISSIWTSLLPTVLEVTLYTPGVAVTSQEPLLAEKAEQIKAVLLAGPSTSQLSLMATGNVTMYSSASTVATVAVFPALQVVHISNGFLAQSPVVELPLPTLQGTFSSASVIPGESLTAEPFYYPTTQLEYFNLQLYYGTILVGSGVFEASYNSSSVNVYNAPLAIPSGYIYPIFEAYYPSQYYPSLVNNTLYGTAQEAFFTAATGSYFAEQGITAVHVALYKVEFVNLCNETITQGVVTVSTTYGKFNVSLLFAYPYTVLQFPVQVNMWNVPVTVVSPTASFTLNYFGYVMPPVNPFTRQAITTPITLEPTVVNLIYFPLIDVVIQVVTNVTTPATPLPGFVVAAYSSVTGQKITEGITNGTTEFVANGHITGFQLPPANAQTGLPNYGTAVIMNVPINASYIMPNSYFELKVRTIIPSTEESWTYTYLQSLWNQTYAEYAAWLGLPSGVSAYTFGTRAQIDEGLVAYYNAQYSIPVNTSCYYTFEIPVYVENLHAYVVDAQNNVLANQLVYPAMALPGAAVWMNTTLLIYDAFSPYNGASVWFTYPYNAWNLTFFSTMGVAGAKSLYTRLASIFYNLTSVALGEGLYSDVLNNQSYLLTSIYLANASGTSQYAVFKIPSYPYGRSSTGFLVRLFMPNQVFYGKVFYLGYEVFSGNIIVPPPGMITLVYANGTIKFVSSYTVYEGGMPVQVPPNSIVIVSSVYPVLLNVTSKSLGYNVGNTVVALTFYDSLFKVLIPSQAVPSSVSSWAAGYLSSLLSPFETLSEAYINAATYIAREGSEYISNSYSGVDYSKYASPQSEYALIAYYLPNLAGYVMAPGVGITELPMSNFIWSGSAYITNVTVGTSIFTTSVPTYVTTPYVSLLFPPSLSGAVKINELAAEVTLPTTTPVTLGSFYGFNSTVSLGFSPSTAALALRTFEAYIYVEPGSSIINATAVVQLLVTNATGTFVVDVATKNLTMYYNLAVGRWVPMAFTVSVQSLLTQVTNLTAAKLLTQVLSGKATVTGEVVSIIVYGTGSGWAFETTPVISTAMGGYLSRSSITVYNNGTGYGKGLVWWRVVPVNGTTLPFATATTPVGWANYFGSPFTLLVSVGPSGEALVDIPTYALNTAGYTPILPELNLTRVLIKVSTLYPSLLTTSPSSEAANALFFARIARAYVLSTPSTPNQPSWISVMTTGYAPSNAIVTLPYVNASLFMVLNAYNVTGNWSTIYVSSLKPGVVAASFSGDMSEGIPGVGFGTGAGFWPLYAIYGVVEGKPLAFIDIMHNAINLPTVYLEGIQVYNTMTPPSPIPYATVMAGVNATGYVYYVNGTEITSASFPTPVQLPFGMITTIPVTGLYGSTFAINATEVLAALESEMAPVNVMSFVEPSMDLSISYYVKYLYNVTYTPYTEAFVFYLYNYAGQPVTVNGYTGELPLSAVQGFITPIVVSQSANIQIPFTELYAGTNATVVQASVSSGYYRLVGKVLGGWVDTGMTFPTTDGDQYIKTTLAGTFTVSVYYAPLTVVQDWNSRPLANQTVAVYFGNNLVGLTVTTQNGTLAQPLPVSVSVSATATYANGTSVTSTALKGINSTAFTTTYTSSAYGVTVGQSSVTAATSAKPPVRIAVYWYDSYPLWLLNPKKYYFIDIYDTSVPNDVYQLGDSFSATSVRTYVYAMTVTVENTGGQPVSNATVLVYDSTAQGVEFEGMTTTGTSGSATIYDHRVSSIGTTVYSQVPATSFFIIAYVPVYDNSYVEAGNATFSIQRGATVPSGVFSVTLRAVYVPVIVGVSTGLLSLSTLTSVGSIPTGANVSITVTEPEYIFNGITSAGVPIISGPIPAQVFSGAFTVPSSGTVTTPVLPISVSGAIVNVTTVQWMHVPIGVYSTRIYTLTPSNATAPIQYTVPAGALTVTPALKPLPTEQTSVTVYYGTTQVTTGSLPGTFVLPVNSASGTTYTVDISIQGVPESLSATVMNGAVQSLIAPAGALAVQFAGGLTPTSYTLNLTYNGMVIASGSASDVSLVLPPGSYSLTGVVTSVPLSAISVSVTNGTTTPVTIPVGKVAVGFASGLVPSSYTLNLLYNGMVIASGGVSDVSVVVPAGSYSINGTIDGVPLSAMSFSVGAGSVASVTIPVGKIAVQFAGGYVPSSYTLNLTYNGMVIASGSASAVSIVVPAGTYGLTGVVSGVPLSPISVSVATGQVASATIPVGKIAVSFAGGLIPSSYSLALQYNGRTIASGSASDVSIIVPSGTYSLIGNVSGVPLSPITVTVSPGTQASVSVPVSQLSIAAYTINGVQLSNAQIAVTYSGKQIAAGVGSVSVIVPGGVSYTVSVSAYGVTNSTTVTPTVGSVMSVRAIVPISGYVIFGAFVPLSTLILVAVIILIVIIIIVVLLIEYGNWRRRRLAGGLFGPGAK